MTTLSNEIGDVSVIVVASPPHRGEAFDAPALRISSF
jgi:molybdopterin synthase catalytic subunit